MTDDNLLIDPVLSGSGHPEAVLGRLRDDEPDAVRRLVEVLEIPSISTLDELAMECRRAAEWFRDELTKLGFASNIEETNGLPAVVAHCCAGAPDRPHVVYYGHYDVQPVDPINDWSTDPFEPKIEDGPADRQIVARGAADDKGQVVAWMEAFRAHRAVHGDYPVDLTVVLEGEEETGSPNFSGLLDGWGRAALSTASVAVISDGNMWDRQTAAIVTQLRGLVYLEITITAGKMDLHSGLYGGSAGNAAMILARILGELKDDSGQIAFPEIYEDLEEPPDDVLAAWNDLDFDEEAFLYAAGLSEPSGEKERPALERLWSRPSVDVHGLWGGFTGKGSKTVIPSRAGAKVSFRIVPGQDPQKVVRGFTAFARARVPADAGLSIVVLEAAPALKISVASEWMEDVRSALSDEMGRPPVMIGCGGSLGAVESFQDVLSIPTLLFSFGLDDDRVHAANEKFELGCFRHAAGAHARLLERWRTRFA